MGDLDQRIVRIRDAFSKRFGISSDPIIVRSPGRINLIGEHTDYNDGFVLPAAVDRNIYFAISGRADEKCMIYSENFAETAEINLRKIERSDKTWPNYLAGVLDQLLSAGYDIGGFDCVFGGSIPIGAGLSSSAAIQAGLAFGLNEMFRLGISRADLAKIAQRSENEFVGVRCGIMDQFANLLSKENSAFRLDCRSLEYVYYPIDQKNLRFILCDTRVNRSLASSAYNLRRQQCEQGVRTISAHDNGIRSLRDVTLGMLDEHKAELDPVVYIRCQYVLEENARVEIACKYLEKADYARFGELLYASHEGLRDEYQVSCTELDVLVDAASTVSGVLGARMMGGGFGGCTLNLVENDALPEFEASVEERYRRKTGKEAKFYECRLAAGTELVAD